MAELDPNIPLNFLSGRYLQNYWEGNPLSSVMDTYLNARKNQQIYDEIERKKQAYANVAQARKQVASDYQFNREKSAIDEQSNKLATDIKSKEARLAEIENELKSIDAEINTASIDSDAINSAYYNAMAAQNAQMRGGIQ